MSQWKLTAEILIEIVQRIPEGFIKKGHLAERFRINKKLNPVFEQVVAEGKLQRSGDYFFDPVRMTQEQLYILRAWCRPRLPDMPDESTFTAPTIINQLIARNNQLNDAERALFNQLPHEGFVEADEFRSQLANPQILDKLLAAHILHQQASIIYDPLRLGEASIREWLRRAKLAETKQALVAYLQKQKDQTSTLTDLYQQFEPNFVNELLNDTKVFVRFETPHRRTQVIQWVTLQNGDIRKAERAAKNASKVPDDEWEILLPHCGEMVRPDARDGNTSRAQVIARTYTLNAAARRLGIGKTDTLEKLIKAGAIDALQDPLNQYRLAADKVEQAYHDPEFALIYTSQEAIKTADIATATGMSYSAIRYRLQKEKLSRTSPYWGDIAGKWGLPRHLREFRDIVKTIRREDRESRRQAYEEKRQQEEAAWQEQLEAEEKLREMLLPIFPTWEHERRELQQIILHVGPPNSGKTHDALLALAEAGSGWYLAPLRLLAFEIFDRLNSRGIPCNLLTGEEHVPIPGAQITASTIEMFNPENSGECIIIDEAQMLADADRGWAWTRALMEAQAPEIHIIAPTTARNLVQKLAYAVSLPITVVEHERLTPIHVAPKHFSLKRLPPRTILVAFSRWNVLNLKTTLEGMRRSVSVIYGNLPPEVRRKQADRFASGETEICIATDAVGMGLNLPADYVCFYELTKFDGIRRRTLNVTEIHQIGGRAGRFGLSEGGQVAALDPREHELVRRAFAAQPPRLSFARVAPAVTALEILPGTLADKLRQWAKLQSIPENLREVLKTGDMSERIELAMMLSPDEEDYLGLEKALKLVNAPTRQNTRFYWRRCVSSIINTEPMPFPPDAVPHINDSLDLEITEEAIHCADIYLWLASRAEFMNYATDEPHVRALRQHWSALIDDALIRRIESARRCSRCGKRMPTGHAFGICDECFLGYSPDEEDEVLPRRGQHLRHAPSEELAEDNDFQPPRWKQPLCYHCNISIPQAGMPRLEHWLEFHADERELTVGQAAWLTGHERDVVNSQIPHDFRQNQIRFWKLETIIQYLEGKPISNGNYRHRSSTNGKSNRPHYGKRRRR